MPRAIGRKTDPPSWWWDAVRAAMRDKGVTKVMLAKAWWRERENPHRREAPTRKEYAKVEARFRRFFDDEDPSRTVEVARFIADQLELPFYEYYPEDLEEAEALESVTRRRGQRRAAAPPLPPPPSRPPRSAPRARP